MYGIFRFRLNMHKKCMSLVQARDPLTHLGFCVLYDKIQVEML